MKNWVSEYCGKVPLAISEGHADGFPTCNPLHAETGLAAFAHIDAFGILKQTSYDTDGIQITENGIIAALHQLKLNNQGVH